MVVVIAWPPKSMQHFLKLPTPISLLIPYKFCSLCIFIKQCCSPLLPALYFAYFNCLWLVLTRLRHTTWWNWKGGGALNIVIKDKLSFRRQKITFVFLIIMLRVLLFVYCFQGSDGGYRWHVIRGISCRCKAVAMFSQRILFQKQTINSTFSNISSTNNFWSIIISQTDNRIVLSSLLFLLRMSPSYSL